MRDNLVGLFCGILFGMGLTISNMVNPNKVLDFLDITGNWDPSLAFVMLAAVVVTWIGYKLILSQILPSLTPKLYLPQKKLIDVQLIIGSSLFGIGWGISGYCPGPAITALGLGIMDAFYFVIGLIFSLLFYSVISTNKN